MTQQGDPWGPSEYPQQDYRGNYPPGQPWEPPQYDPWEASQRPLPPQDSPWDYQEPGPQYRKRHGGTAGPPQFQTDRLDAERYGQPQYGQQPQSQPYQQPQYRQAGPQFTAQPQYRPPGPPQQPYAPAQYAPQPSQPSQPRKSRKGLAFLGCGGLGALVILIVVLASSSSPSSPTPPPAATQTAAQPDCAAQLTSWAGTGEGAQLTAFGTDIGTFGDALDALAAGEQDGDGTAGEMSAVQSAAASMQSDAQALEASPGPSCVPGLADNLSAAARDYSTAAIGADNAINQMSAGADDTAAGDLQSADTAMTEGNAKISAANTALKPYEASGGA